MCSISRGRLLCSCLMLLLAYGVRFSFIQDYFSLLCSDVREYPVAWAVTASSAVPVVFNPIELKNYPGCAELQASPQVTELAKQNDELAQMLTGLESYKDKVNREFIHFVDGGITDNLGLRAMTDIQLHRYNAATIDQVRNNLANWSA